MNLEQLRAKVKGLEEGKPKSKKWKPKTKHTVRLLPLPTDDDIAFVVKWHYGVDNGRQMACPSTWGNQCDFCDLAVKLKAWKNEDGTDKSEATRKKDWEWFKKLDAAVKHYAPIVEKVEKEKGVGDLQGPFLWEMTPKSYLKLAQIASNDDWNDAHTDGGALKILTSTKQGLDLTVELKKANSPGNQTSYDLTAIEERKKFSTLGTSNVQAILDKIPTMDDISKPVSSEDASRVFAAWQKGLESAPAEGGEGGAGVEYGSNNGETVAVGGSDADDVVDKLMNLIGDK